MMLDKETRPDRWHWIKTGRWGYKYLLETLVLRQRVGSPDHFFSTLLMYLPRKHFYRRNGAFQAREERDCTEILDM